MTRNRIRIFWTVLFFLLLARALWGSEDRTVAALMRAPIHYSDVKAHWADVAYWRHEVARAVNEATPDPNERAALVRIAIEETNLALYVLEGRCKDGPKGACDNGRAKGPWQLQPSFAVRVIPDDFASQARLALKRWRGALKRCAEFGKAGAFMGYGTGGRCEPKQWAKDRATRLKSAEAWFWGPGET